MQKKNYLKPEVTITVFSTEDIMATSTHGNGREPSVDGIPGLNKP